MYMLRSLLFTIAFIAATALTVMPVGFLTANQTVGATQNEEIAGGGHHGGGHRSGGGHHGGHHHSYNRGYYSQPYYYNSYYPYYYNGYSPYYYNGYYDDGVYYNSGDGFFLRFGF